MIQINPILLLPPHIPAESETTRKGRETTPARKYKAGDKVSATYRSGSIINGEIVSPVEGSRTLYVIRDTDRGAGWDERLQKYVGVSFRGGWQRGENYGFNLTHTFHINQITPKTTTTK
jgi:hypothetical protein